MTTQEPVGEVMNYFEHVGVAAIKLSGDVNVGDVLKFVGGEVDFDSPVENMQMHKEFVEKASKGDEVGIKVKEKVRKGYKVFKVESSE